MKEHRRLCLTSDKTCRILDSTKRAGSRTFVFGRALQKIHYFASAKGAGEKTMRPLKANKFKMHLNAHSYVKRLAANLMCISKKDLSHFAEKWSGTTLQTQTIEVGGRRDQTILAKNG